MCLSESTLVRPKQAQIGGFPVFENHPFQRYQLTSTSDLPQDVSRRLCEEALSGLTVECNSEAQLPNRVPSKRSRVNAWQHLLLWPCPFFRGHPKIVVFLVVSQKRGTLKKDRFVSLCLGLATEFGASLKTPWNCSDVWNCFLDVL